MIEVEDYRLVKESLHTGLGSLQVVLCLFYLFLYDGLYYVARS